MLHYDWISRVEFLLDHGTPVGPRGLMTHEDLGAQLTVDCEANLLDVPARKLNFRFAVAEWLWMAFGRSDVESLARYNSVMRSFSDDGIFLTGAYGPHINAQRRNMVRKLKTDPHTRQAVIEIPRPQRTTKDEPCTLSFQYLLRDGRLNQIVTMRSSDAWLGIPYDVFTFTQLQNCFAGELGVKRGWLQLNMGSSHLYERDFDAARGVMGAYDSLDADTADVLSSPTLSGFPPLWLESMLLTDRNASVPNAIPVVTHPTSDDAVWEMYGRVLLSKSSEEARSILRAGSIL